MLTDKFNHVYFSLVILRIVLVCVPQFGYIHPDEYFQSIEILAGRTFDVESSPPWEFNTSLPIRSMALSYLTTGLSYKLLNLASYFANEFVGISIATPYFLLVIPRLVMCLLSLLVDLSVYKICRNNNEKFKSKLIILASSYVMIVYATRTFSNTIELILFAILLYYVSESLIFSNILIKKYEYLNYRYERSKTVVEKAKFHKLKLYLPSDLLRNCVQISILTVSGFFNRPTFLAFALFPVFFWLYRGLGSKVVVPLNYYLRIVAFIICCIPTTIIFVVIDSFFYYFISWGEIGMLDISINNFVFTPLNFFKYNSDFTNLAVHGLHPRYLHLLVNIPLLFNVLGMCGIFGFVQYGARLAGSKYHLLPTVRSIKGLMALSLLAPIALLSIFPHQEPRFLIPLIVPLVYLHSNTILSEPDNTVIIKSDKKITKEHLNEKKVNRMLLKLWLVLNAVCIVFYGFVHQGGVYQATNYLSNELKTLKASSTECHIITSHIYSIPVTFFLRKNNRFNIINKQRMLLYEEGSTDLSVIIRQIYTILNVNDNDKSNKKGVELKLREEKQVYLIIPSVLEHHLYHYYVENKNLNFTLLQSFYPHLSTEAAGGLLSHKPLTDYLEDFYSISSFWMLLKHVFLSFRLNLYKVSVANF